MHIAIAGNIGSGKTTLTKMLAKRYGWKANFEPVDNNPYLADYYKDMERFELKGTYNGITLADDYAHHPREIEVTLEAAMKMGYKRVWAVHQPFTYSRTAKLLDDFARVLQIADKCVVSEIMGSRETNEIGIKATDLSDKIPGCIQIDKLEDIADYLAENCEDGDLVITLGCGDVYKVTKYLIEKLKSKQ